VNTLLCNLLSSEQAIVLNPHLPVWFNPQWMNPVAALNKLTPKVLVCFKNDNPIAFLPFYEKTFITIRKALNPALVYYCPIVFITPDRKHSNREMLLEYEIIKQMGEFLSKRYNRVAINLSPELFDIRGFKDAGFSAKPQYTFCKDLTKTEDFFSDEMTKLRKAQKFEYEFVNNFDPERHLELLYQMYSRKKHPFSVDRNGMLLLLHSLNNAGMIEQYTINKNGIVVSSMLNLLDKGKTVYGWQAASEQEDMKNGVSLLMFWNMFKTLSERFEVYDLCGANVKGPSRLKAAMGAELKLFFQVIKN